MQATEEAISGVEWAEHISPVGTWAAEHISPGGTWAAVTSAEAE